MQGCAAAGVVDQWEVDPPVMAHAAMLLAAEQRMHLAPEATAHQPRRALLHRIKIVTPHLSKLVNARVV